ncbi:AmmeMemoRadiSam system protein B [Aurantivibrio plasticivorans]
MTIDRVDTNGIKAGGTNVRRAAVAGQFYSDNPDQLQRDVMHYLQHNSQPHEFQQHALPLHGLQGHQLPPDDFDPIRAQDIKAIVVPHAGYIYSGSVAATAFNAITARKSQIKRVILLGPSHRVPLSRIALPNANAFETPLGSVPLDVDILQQLKKFPEVEVNALAHQFEHSLEVQLPFLQTVLDNFQLVPLVVGDVSPDVVAKLLAPFIKSPENLIVISSDLSHFHPYREAQAIDHHTSELIEAKSYTLHGEQACGCNPLNGLLKLAVDNHWTVATIDQCNSGDTAGNKDQVVGYGAYLVYQPAT